MSVVGVERRKAHSGERDRMETQKRNVDGLLESSVFCLPGEISLQEVLACFVFGSW